MAKREVNEYPREEYVDANLILSELEGRTINIRDKLNLVSKNFISLKKDVDEKLDTITGQVFTIKKDLESLKKTVHNITQESEKWLRRDELILIERMLKDFQPLEFIRKKDFEEFVKLNLINQPIK